MNQPDNLRAATLAQRDRLSAQQRRHKSERIAATLLASEAVLASNLIFVYVNFRSEVETVSLIRSLLKMGKQVSVPLTSGAEKRLDIVVLEDPDRDLAPGYCAIPEPTKEVAEADLDAMLPRKRQRSVVPRRAGRSGGARSSVAVVA